MYVDSHHFTFDDGQPVYSIHDLSRKDIHALYRALATVPLSPDDRLYELRDTIFRFLADSQ